MIRPYNEARRLSGNLQATRLLTLDGESVRLRTVRNCPVCASGKTRSYGQVEIELERTPIVLNYDECNSCGTAFQNPTLTRTARRLLYDANYMKAYGSDRVNLSDPNEQIWRSILSDNRFQALLGIMPSLPKTYLDVGFGFGTSLETAALYGIHASGIEVSSSAWQNAQQRGLNVFNGEMASALREGFIKPGSIDFITAWDVVEHYDDLSRELGLLREALRPKGMLYLHTPDFSTEDTENKHRYFSLDHRLLFSRNSLRNLLEANGFTVLQCVPSQQIGDPRQDIHPSILSDPRFPDAREYVMKKSPMLIDGHWHIGLLATTPSGQS